MKKIFYGVVLALLTVLAIPNTVSAESITAKENWNKIVTAMKNDQYIKQIGEEEGKTLTITSDDTMLKLEIAYDFLETYTITYNHYNGMVVFNTTNTKEDDMLLALDEEFIHYSFLYAVEEAYGYEAYSLINWIENESEDKLEYEKDGIEFAKYTVKDDYGTEETDDDLEATTFKTLKINIDCGIPTFEDYVPTETPNEPTPEQPQNPSEPTPEPEQPQNPVEPTPKPEQSQNPVEPTPEPEQPKENVETTVENPATGLRITMGLCGVAIIGLLVFMICKKKTYFSKI